MKSCSHISQIEYTDAIFSQIEYIGSQIHLYFYILFSEVKLGYLVVRIKQQLQI